MEEFFVVPPAEATRCRLLVPEWAKLALATEALLLPSLPMVHGESEPSKPPLVTRLTPLVVLPATTLTSSR